MAPYTVNTTSSSEDEDAPEAFSLAQSKQYAETQDDALKKFQAKEKQRQKDRNRERDRKLKERAEKTKNTKKLEERDDVQTRMERSMQNAEEEMGDEEHGSDGEDDIEGSENDMSTEESEYEGMELSVDKEDHAIQSDHESEGESDGGGFVTKQLQANPRGNPQHLPDHLFASAFTPKTHPSTSKTPSLASTSRRIDNVRRQKHKVRGKDLIVGSRTVRALSSASQPSTNSASMTIPPRRTRKFIDRSLNFKGGKSKTKGWERRPVNIGVLRRDGGPAFGFVRGQ